MLQPSARKKLFEIVKFPGSLPFIRKAMLDWKRDTPTVLSTRRSSDVLKQLPSKIWLPLQRTNPLQLSKGQATNSFMLASPQDVRSFPVPLAQRKHAAISKRPPSPSSEEGRGANAGRRRRKLSWDPRARRGDLETGDHLS